MAMFGISKLGARDAWHLPPPLRPLEVHPLPTIHHWPTRPASRLYASSTFDLQPSKLVRCIRTGRCAPSARPAPIEMRGDTGGDRPRQFFGLQHTSRPQCNKTQILAADAVARTHCKETTSRTPSTQWRRPASPLGGIAAWMIHPCHAALAIPTFTDPPARRQHQYAVVTALKVMARASSHYVTCKTHPC